jgi:thermitase
MRLSRILTIIAAMFLVLTFASGVLAASPPNGGDAPQSAPERILVRFKPGVGPAETAQIHRQYGGHVEEVIPGIGIQVVNVPKGQLTGKVRSYSSNGKVAYAEPDFLAQAVDSPDDPYFGRQWGLTRVEAPQAWEVTTGSSNINIAILDTGVDQDHPDLAAKLISNKNFTTSATVDDVHGHGTHVAGIAAAITNNGIGVAGLGYTSTIMNVKVLGDSGSGYYSWIIWGIAWAADHGAEVINMSLGGSSSSSALEDAINYAWSRGVIVVAAAGNSGSTPPSYPAYYNNCMAVAATDVNDAKPSWSNYGDWVDVAAPGASIYSTLKDNSYGYKSGTSMASPYVAGLAGLVFATVSDSNGDGKLNDEVRNRIETTCDDIGLSGIGYGRINAARAVESVTVLPGKIAGQVTDAQDGSAISGVQLTDGTRTALTDAAGMYTIDDVSPGTYQVVACKEGYEDSPLTVDVLSGNTAIANFSLSQIIVPGSISGSVTDAQDGSPIAGAVVSDGSRAATTDTSGEYTIADVPPGSYEVTASKEGYGSSTSSVTVISGASSVLNFSLNQNPTVPNIMWVDSIALSKNGRNLFIEVKVVTASSVLPGAEVALSLECSTDKAWNFSGTTDTAGLVRFKLNKPPAGNYLATVNSLTCNGFAWDMSKGITSASYTPNSINGRTTK